MELTQSPSTSDESHPTRTKIGRWLLVGLAALLIVLVGYKVARIGYYSWSAYRSGMGLLAMAQDDPSLEKLVDAQPKVQRLSGALGGLEREMRLFTPVLRRFRGVTIWGSAVAATPDLLVAGAELSAVAAEGLTIVSPALSQEPGAALPDRLLGALDGHPAEFAHMAEQAAGANQALQSIPAASLPPVLAGPLAQAQAISPLLAPGLGMAPALPDLLGLQRPHTYLLLLQNNHELRGSGGFITGVGQVTVEEARLATLTFSDSYNVDNHTVDHPPAPLPMQAFMDTELLFLRDANWSPDFPTSARTARTIYARDQGIQVDGVIAIDLRAVELIVDAVGPLQIDGIDDPVTGENVVELIKELWGNPLGVGASVDEDFRKWWARRKDFMPAMAQAILDRIQSGRFNYLSLVSAGREALAERAVQVWTADPAVAAQLAQQGWDGGLHPIPGSDFLMLVDSNVGFNKVDAVVSRSVEYWVDWPDGSGEPARAVAAVTYKHPIQKPGYVCDQTPRYGDSYDAMTERCYFDYVRLYVPENSRLLSVEGVAPNSISSKRGEAKTQVFAGFFVLKPGETQTVVFTYRLPPGIQPETYQLLVQRQAGSGPLPLRWQVADRAFRYTVTKGTFSWAP